MASLLERLSSRVEPAEARSITTVDEFIASVREAAFAMSWPGTTAPSLDQRAALTQNGIVFAVMAVRLSVFSAINFRWQRMRDGRGADMFGSRDLVALERPWPGGTTQDLLTRMLQDADLVGNAFHVKDTPLARLGGDDQGEIVRLRPDWVRIVTERRYMHDGRSRGSIGRRKIGYVYREDGFESDIDPVPLMLHEVSHFMPMPDPLLPFRGMSWLTPVVREVEADVQMTTHKRKLLENGATPNLIIRHPVGSDRDKVLDYAKRLEAQMSGSANAGKTLNLYPGADATVVGADMKQLDFRAVQGAGETRIAAAGGTPPVIVGLSEGLASATYSNYGQARRRFADGTMHPLWQNAAGSLAPLMPDLGPDVRLWYDAENVPFLREDEKDAAEINQVRATTISSLITAGYEPTSVVAAVDAGDFRLLVHTGLYSVQLQRPGSDQPSTAPEGATQ